jgi:hypothetical protein
VMTVTDVLAGSTWFAVNYCMVVFSSLLTAALSSTGSPALSLDKPIVGKAQRSGSQVYTHTHTLWEIPFEVFHNCGKPAFLSRDTSWICLW